MAGGKAGAWLRGALLLALALLLVPLTASQNPGAPRGKGTGPATGGNMQNIADPPGRLPRARLPERPEDAVPPTLSELNKLSVYDFDPTSGIHVDDFTLWTIDDLGRPDPSPQQYLRLEGRKMQFGGYHLVVYLRDAPGLFDMLFYVRYHQERWHPRQIEPGSAFGFEGDRLFLGKLDIPGVVVGGVTRVRPDVKGPTKLADGVVAEIVFEERPFDYRPDVLTHAPDGDGDKPENLQVYIDDSPRGNGPNDRPSGDVVLYWEERNVGDYNNDGEVMVSDLVPVGRRFGRLSADGFEDDWDRLPDGNADGEINRRDQWEIQDHYGALLSGYRVYRRPTGSPRRDEVLLRHRTDPLLPLSIHRPRGWDLTRRIAYRYYDRDLPRTAMPQRWTYRIVPYDAVNDIEGLDSDIELTVSVTDSSVQMVGVADRKPGTALPLKPSHEAGRT